MSQLYALVLTASPQTKILNEQFIRHLLSIFPNKLESKPKLLNVNAAYEIVWSPKSFEEAKKTQQEFIKFLTGLPIDVNVVSADPSIRRKRLLVADMESTIIEQELINELAAIVHKKEEIAVLTLKTMCGEIEFKESLRQRIKLLNGLSSDAFDIVLDQTTIMPGAKILIKRMKAEGAKTALLTGGFIYFAEKISKKLCFDHHFGNLWQVKDNKITGELLEPIIDAEAKKKHLIQLTETYKFKLEDTLVVGDGANDLLMLEAAGLGVAYRAKPIVREAMTKNKRGAVIEHSDLTALLALQGYVF